MRQSNVAAEYGECPNCGAIWGFQEIEWERCFSCGYPGEPPADDSYPDGKEFEDFYGLEDDPNRLVPPADLP